MAMSLSGTLTKEQLHNEVFERVCDNPHEYRMLDPEYQSDPDICLATLLSYECNNDDDDVDEILIDIFETILSHLPNFVDHRSILFQFVKSGNPQPIELYIDHFRAEIEQDREFLKRALACDRTATLFQLLSEELRLDPELLKISVENLSDEVFSNYVQSTPLQTLMQHEFILLRALDLFLYYHQVPPSFWENRNLVLKWIEEKRDRLPTREIPSAFNRDREICLSLYRTMTTQHDFHELKNWMAKSLLNDKEFVLECLGHYPMIFFYCDQELQEDFELQLEAAYRASVVRPLPRESGRTFANFEPNSERKLFIAFMEKLGKSLATRVNAVRSRLEAHNEFMTFLACSWKSRQAYRLSLNGLNCDDETGRGLKTMIGRYLGFCGTRRLERLQRVWDEIVFVAVGGSIISTLSPKLMPLIPPQALVQGVLKAIECRRYVSLAMYPVELWTNRLFVKWAATKGMINKAVPHEFSSDPEICFSYYKHSRDVRESILPWISESLKTNRDFVLKCVSFSPLILNFCKENEILYDFEVLQVAACKAVAKDEVDYLVEMSLENGWAEALAFFAKSLHAEIQVLSAVEAFVDQLKTLGFGEAAAAVQPLIGSYLGIVSDCKKLRSLQETWSHRSIFFLALGGKVMDLCNASKFRAKRKRKTKVLRKNGWFDDDSSDNEW
jgi:hypothetical protein